MRGDQKGQLATRLDGYVQAHLASYVVIDYTRTWLQPRLEAVEATLNAAERTAALESGARLDRRGLMRLLTDAEQRVHLQTTAELVGSQVSEDTR